ncbi:MAG TPA: hypothetical protein VNF99_08030 [Stellaceae bacterium]|nr:hypothetical protein [Stellaceae bacterium]
MKSKILPAILAAVTLISVAAPAFADDNGHYRDRDRGREREHHYRRGPYVNYNPGYVYAPPPVVYAPPPPPPVEVEPSLNFVIPLNFR